MITDQVRGLLGQTDYVFGGYSMERVTPMDSTVTAATTSQKL